MSLGVARDAVETARRLAPMIAAAGDAIEAERRLTPAVVDALHAAGLFGCCCRAISGAPSSTSPDSRW